MTRIAFDIGGTFTDFALMEAGKPLLFHKAVRQTLIPKLMATSK